MYCIIKKKRKGREPVMCGRLYVEPELSDEELRGIIEAVNRRTGGEASTGEVFPSSTVAAVANDKSGAPRPFPMKWGYERGGGSLLINARSETAAQKPMFRESMRLRRCLIPATNYFEWQKLDGGKKKYAIRPDGAKVLYMAGLYRLEKDAPRASCVILTREASKSVAHIHNRMPVILPRERLAEWLSPDADAESVLGAALERMRAEPAAG